MKKEWKFFKANLKIKMLKEDFDLAELEKFAREAKKEIGTNNIYIRTEDVYEEENYKIFEIVITCKYKNPNIYQFYIFEERIENFAKTLVSKMDNILWEVIPLRFENGKLEWIRKKVR